MLLPSIVSSCSSASIRSFSASRTSPLSRLHPPRCHFRARFLLLHVSFPQSSCYVLPLRLTSSQPPKRYPSCTRGCRRIHCQHSRRLRSSSPFLLSRRKRVVIIPHSAPSDRRPLSTFIPFLCTPCGHEQSHMKCTTCTQQLPVPSSVVDTPSVLASYTLQSNI